MSRKMSRHGTTREKGGRSRHSTVGGANTAMSDARLDIRLKPIEQSLAALERAVERQRNLTELSAQKTDAAVAAAKDAKVEATKAQSGSAKQREEARALVRDCGKLAQGLHAWRPVVEEDLKRLDDLQKKHHRLSVSIHTADQRLLEVAGQAEEAFAVLEKKLDVAVGLFKVHYDAGTRPGISKQSYSTCGSCHRPYDPVALQAGARQWTALPVRPILAVRQEKPKPTRTRWLRPREPAVDEPEEPKLAVTNVWRPGVDSPTSPLSPFVPAGTWGGDASADAAAAPESPVPGGPFSPLGARPSEERVPAPGAVAERLQRIVTAPKAPAAAAELGLQGDVGDPAGANDGDGGDGAGGDSGTKLPELNP